MTDPRDAILNAALPGLGFDGFSTATILTAARAAGVAEASALAVFPRGGIDLARHYAAFCDNRLLERLGQEDLGALKIRARVTRALNARLDILAGERETIRRLVQTFALPTHAADGAAALYQAVDVIWSAVGDRSTDFNFYTKRAILAGVLSATTLYWLQDESADFADTRAFIDRRIANVMEIEKAKARLAAIRLPDVAGWLGRLRHGGARGF